MIYLRETLRTEMHPWLLLFLISYRVFLQLPLSCDTKYHLTMFGPVQVLLGSLSSLTWQDLWSLPDDPSKVPSIKSNGLMATSCLSTASRGLSLILSLPLVLLGYLDRFMGRCCVYGCFRKMRHSLFGVRGGGQREIVHPMSSPSTVDVRVYQSVDVFLRS